ncbi:MAG: HU family DNA-binding protein [Duncaniella sp.]|nr:HU family DNA-binding protein [Duncaniella sp.]
MNQKIPFPQISARLAEICNISQAEAEEFGKVFFDIIAETLCSGESVKIKGIGIFSPTQNSAQPVEFTPDSVIADTINAPFAMFEPEALSEDVSIDEIESIQTADETADLTETPSETTEVTVGRTDSISGFDQSSAQEPVLARESIEQSAIMVEAKASNIAAAPSVEESVIEEVHSPSSEPDEMSATNPVENSENKIAAPSETVKAETTVAECTVPIDKPAETTATKPVSTVVPVYQANDSDVSEEEEEYISESTDKKRSGLGFGWGFLVGILVGLALGACAVFLAIDYIYPTHDDISELLGESAAIEEEPLISDVETVTEPLANDTADSAVTDSIHVKEDSEEAAAEPRPSAENNPQEVAEQTAPEPVFDIIRPGYLLNDMAKKHYGNKCFWVYIYKENQDKIKNPNRVTPGMKLVIPMASKYGINAKDQMSIKEANALAGKILEKYPR